MMLYRLLADAVVIAHLGFVVFVVLGGGLLLRGKSWAWIHVPAVLWAAFVEFTGWTCPLTPLENWLRTRGGTPAYHTPFIEHHVLPVLYPATLTRDWQVLLGLLVVVINLAVYAWVLRRPSKTSAS
jgi:hypothetical protein